MARVALLIALLGSPMLIPNPARASVVSFTGAELAVLPGVSLHPTITSVSGSSLVFGPIEVAPSQFEKLVTLPLLSLGVWASVDDAVVTASLNLTRLACVQGFGSSCGPTDHDAVIALGNGSTIVGTEIADNSNGSAFLDEFSDAGQHGVRTRHDIMFVGSGFPEIGEPYDVTVTFLLSATSTTVSTTLLGGTARLTGLALGRPADLDFLFMRDNDPGERYQLNTLTISSDALTVATIPVPEPTSLTLLAIGLTVLGSLLTGRDYPSLGSRVKTASL